MAVKNVTKGEKITANWANSLVDTVNALGGVDLRGRSARNSNKNTHRPYQPHSQFLIRKTANLTYTIEAGSIFVDGELIQSASPSHFQYSSLMDYETNCSYTPKSSDDLPIWYVDIFTTKNEELQKHIALLKVKGYLEPFQESTISDYAFNTRYILNTVDLEKKEVKQIFSGSIFLQTVGKDNILELISLIAGDGIQIDYADNAFTIKANISVIPEDNFILVNQRTEQDGQITVGLSLNSDILTDQISIIGGDYIRVDYDKKNYTIHNTMSIIAGDGITVSKIDGDGILISLTPPTVSVIHVDGIVTMNGSQIVWGNLGEGTFGADLCQLQIDKATFTLRVEKVTDANGLTFLKFGF